MTRLPQPVISSLCQANQAILHQKCGLMKVISNKYGLEKALQIYQTTCPTVHASIGQHFRHSLDHVERAAIAAADAASNSGSILDIEYDTRERGIVDEYDWDACKQRIKSIHMLLEQVHVTSPKPDRDVRAHFMLSGDSDQQYPLPTTIARELGFAAHHAIHHMAMVRVIATCQQYQKSFGEDIDKLLNDGELPLDFGRAPSTVNFDIQQGRQKQGEA